MDLDFFIDKFMVSAKVFRLSDGCLQLGSTSCNLLRSSQEAVAETYEAGIDDRNFERHDGG